MHVTDVTCLLLLQLRETLNQGPSWRDCVEVKHGYYKETPLLFATWNKKYDVVNVLLQFKVPTNSLMIQSIFSDSQHYFRFFN